MFEIGFSEMLLIGIVALVVLGPERLPKAARFVGLWVRRVRAYWFNMRAELERELAAEEMKKHLDEARAALREAEQRMAATTSEASAALSGHDATTSTSPSSSGDAEPAAAPDAVSQGADTTSLEPASHTEVPSATSHSPGAPSP